MLLTKPGIYRYKNAPAKVWQQAYQCLCFEQFVPDRMGFVADTDAEDWGHEIVPPDRGDNQRVEG